MDDGNQTGNMGHDDARSCRASIDADTLSCQRVDPCLGREQDHLREGVGQQGQARLDMTNVHHSLPEAANVDLEYGISSDGSPQLAASILW